MNKYELTIVLEGKATAAKKKSTTEKIEKMVKDLKGKVVKVKDWGVKDLTFKIQKHETGAFLIFELELELNCAGSCPFHRECNTHYYNSDFPCKENIDSVIDQLTISLVRNPVLDPERPLRKYANPIIQSTMWRNELDIIIDYSSEDTAWTRPPREILFGSIKAGKVRFGGLESNVYDRVNSRAPIAKLQPEE